MQVDDTNELSNLVLYEVKKEVKKGISIHSLKFCDLSQLINFPNFIFIVYAFCRWERERELAISRRREDIDDDDEARMKGTIVI